MINRIIISLAIAIALSSNMAFSKDAVLKKNASPVNKTITKEVDVTGDSISEVIVLNLKGESWQKPFKWILTINSKGIEIFKYQSDDKWLDAFFADEGYVDNCTDYLSCKKKYYEKDILDRLVVITDLSPNEHAYDK